MVAKSLTTAIPPVAGSIWKGTAISDPVGNVWVVGVTDVCGRGVDVTVRVKVQTPVLLLRSTMDPEVT
jgi:hypothetical protein